VHVKYSSKQTISGWHRRYSKRLWQRLCL